MQTGNSENYNIYFNNYNGYCNSVEINNTTNTIYTSWFLYDIGGILQNRTYNNINEIAVATKSLINDDFKLEINENSFINPFNDELTILKYDYNITPFEILHDDDKLNKVQSHIYTINKNQAIPYELNFNTSNGIYSDKINTIFSTPYIQKYNIGILNNNINNIPNNKNIEINISNLITQNNINTLDTNIKYFVDYICNENIITYNENNILNDFHYNILSNKQFEAINITVNLYYKRKYTNIIIGTTHCTNIYIGDVFNTSESTEVETILGTNLNINVLDKVYPEFISNEFIGINASMINENGNNFSYNISNNTIEGISNQNINSITIFNINAYNKANNEIIRDFPSCYIIKNKELSGEIYINNIKTNSIVYIKNNDEISIEYNGEIFSDTLNNYDLLSGFELQVINE